MLENCCAFTSHSPHKFPWKYDETDSRCVVLKERLAEQITPLSVKTALTKVPERCLFGSDAPCGEPKLCRQLIEFVSSSNSITEMALGGNIERLLQI